MSKQILWCPLFASLIVIGLGSPALAQPNLNLPGGVYEPTLTFDTNYNLSTHSYFAVTFSDLLTMTPPFDVINGNLYAAWCVDITGRIVVPNTGVSSLRGTDAAGTTLAFKLYNTLGTQASFAQGLLSALQLNPAAWNEVNYVLNHKGSASVGNIQEAIWKLIFGTYVISPIPFPDVAPSPVSDALVSAAEANSSFVPGPGQTVAVLLDANGLAGTPQDIIIEVPVPSTCTIQAVIISDTSWNKFNVPSGSSPVVWIHAHIGRPSNVSLTGISQVLFSNVKFVLNGTTYALPDGLITFNPAAPSTITTSFTGGEWETVVNPNFLSDEIFFTGAAVPVDSNISGGGKATLSYAVSTNDAQLSFQWQWSAAAYTFWPTDWNQAQIQPYHGNGLHAGTPLNSMVQKSLIQGPRGGGGSNFTGSWSATGNGVCPVP